MFSVKETNFDIGYISIFNSAYAMLCFKGPAVFKKVAQKKEHGRNALS